jgi:hypothetical protein
VIEVQTKRKTFILQVLHHSSCNQTKGARRKSRRDTEMREKHFPC